jgi:hypothetical protein
LKSANLSDLQGDIVEEGKKYAVRVQASYLATVKLMHDAENPQTPAAVTGTAQT